MKISILTIKSLALVSAFVFSVASMETAQAKECDMPDEIAAGDSAAVRDECPDESETPKEQRKKNRNGANTSKQDKSKTNTDGTERANQYERDNGTGPTREGRY
jgi:hypothetical protein